MNEQPFERALPNSSEAERAVLGAILLNNDLIGQTVETLKAEDFYVPSHRRIVTAMAWLFEHGREISPILIGEELKKEAALEAVGGVSFITNLTYGLPHSTNIEHYAKVIRGKSMLRRLIKTSSKITQEALAEEDEPEVVLDHAESAIFELGQERLRGKFESVKPIAESILEKIQEQEGRHEFILGLDTGYADINRMTSGLKKQDLIILAARPSVGKTSFALMLAENAALLSHAVVGIFSLEMSKEALVMRLLCAMANIDFSRFRNGFLSRLEWGQVAKALGVLCDLRIFLDDTPGISVLEMRAKAKRLATEQKKLDLIIVDYLQLMSGSSKRAESRQQEVSQISRELKGLAKEMDVPLVALSQLSRAPESRSNHRPQMADLRDSGSIEQDCDELYFLYRDELYKSAEEREAMPEDRKNIAELIIAKQRNGPTGTVDLRFTPGSMRFDSLYRETSVLPALNYGDRG